MSRRGTAALGVTAVMIVLGVLTVLPSIARETPPPIAVEFLTSRAVFTDDVDLQVKAKLDGAATKVINSTDPSRTVVARITVQPGAQFPWHTHPGPVLVNVAQGELVYVPANDCMERSYPVGAAFVDPGRGFVHTAFNPTNGVTVVVATFLEIEPGGPLTINAEAPDNCQIEVGEHSH